MAASASRMVVSNAAGARGGDEANFGGGGGWDEVEKEEEEEEKCPVFVLYVLPLEVVSGVGSCSSSAVRARL